MGREVRTVPENWQHPHKGKHADGTLKYIPLFDGSRFQEQCDEWDLHCKMWNNGLKSDYNGGWKPLDGKEGVKTYEEWNGSRPVAKDYMPRWTENEKTHYMMYEACSEGTPISPAFATPEELARWLADTNASAFADIGASYEAWLRIAKGGYACSAVYTPENGLQSGAQALNDACLKKGE